MLQILGAGPCLLFVRPAAATPESLAEALRETFGDRKIRQGKVKLEMPALAENGNVVPVVISVDSPMTEQEHVKSIHIFAEKNPLPKILEMYFSPDNGKARVSSRIRVATSQQVTAIAVLSDDTVWSSAVNIEVTLAACGL